MQKQTYEYKKAGLAQIDELVPTRLVVLRAANQLSDAVDLSQVERETYEYYKNARAAGGNVLYGSDQRFAGVGDSAWKKSTCRENSGSRPVLAMIPQKSASTAL